PGHAHDARQLERHALRLGEPGGPPGGADGRSGVVRVKNPHRFLAGFSLLEVLVTLIVIAIGLLGLAKTQAAAVSNTQVSRVRSLIALQAESLAGAMHGNRGYWAAGVR